jgi:predicted nucleic acid-binding protein
MTVPYVTIDASAAVRWILDDEANQAGALTLRSALVEGRVVAVEPSHFLLEVAGALDRAVRDGRIDHERARSALFALEAVSFDDVPPMAVAADAFDVATSTALRVPDAAYLVCAARNHAQLVTADRRQLEAGEQLGIPAVALSDLPPW